MTKIIHFLIALFVFSSSLFAEGYSIEEQVYPTQTQTQSKSLFVSMESIPSKVYVGQVFPVKLKAIIATQNFDDVTMEMQNSTNVEIINPNSTWETTGDRTYFNTYYLKVTSTTATLPSLSISLLSNKSSTESQTITLPKLTIVQLKKDALFCNVIADNLTVNKYKTTTFDDKNNITVLEIEASNSNLKDFALAGIAKSGIDSFSENGTTQKIYYYAILPNYQKTFEFTYFDLPTNKFSKISLPVIAENDEVSTQLGLNPKESIFEFYKSIAYAVGAFIFFVIFIRRRRFFYLFLALIFFTLFFLDKNPMNNVFLKDNSSVMILPTEHSTIFFTNTKSIPVEKLGQRDNYIKILLPDGKIGWTLDENIIKN
ncbi:MAG: hypothetical protein PHR87_02625 [Sulfurospirillaceae bacterium]|nr:hypothetical protein [Sulfurospirillaceae bacterium]